MGGEKLQHERSAGAFVDHALDGYLERHLYAWDALAGLLLVEEAGGRVNAFLEGDALTAGNETVAATPDLYDALLAASRFTV